MIPARVTVVTLGVRDMAAMKAFYAGLGWRNLNPELEEYAAFDTGGATLALYPYDMLAEDGRIPATPAPQGFRGVTLAINVERPELVDETIAQIAAAGGRITKQPEDASWGGRSAYFADPEGNAWEVAWAPGAVFDARGAIVWRQQEA